ncbi:MAG: hypothetical protein ACQEP5_08040 [Actinomycetota bacterium]
MAIKVSKLKPRAASDGLSLHHEGRLTLKKAIEIAYYHIRRNEAARLSCRKKKMKLLQKAG